MIFSGTPKGVQIFKMPTKRRKVEINPNSKFVTIWEIRRAHIAARAIKAESADEEVSQNTTGAKDCTLVGMSADEGDDADEG